jgi:hypothetical protein
MTDVRLDSAEVRRQLQRRRRSTGEDFQQLLERYALDRFLYRLGLSRHRSTLVLKGAVLFSAWLDIPHRPTRDVDFALMQSPAESDLALVRDIVADVCVVDVPEDGVTFDSESISVEAIREGASYAGARATLLAGIGTARVKVQIDVGFGDVVTPGPNEELIPAMLDQARASVLAYPRESVVAEKLEIIVQLGLVNSRMKDYFDLRALAATFRFDGTVLVDAVGKTFERRRTQVPVEIPVGLSDAFAADPAKVALWSAFLGRIGRADDGSFAGCVSEVRRFAGPVLHFASASGHPALGTWKPGIGWRAS